MNDMSLKSNACSWLRRRADAAGRAGLALAWMAIPIAAGAQAPNTIKYGPISAPPGYVLHQTIDAGGRIANQTGSLAMYDTLVNEQSGPRLMGHSLDLRPLPENKKPFADSLRAFASGFGGEAYDLAKLDLSKKKIYAFSGQFRRNRQYFDYDLLGNPNIPVDKTIPIGPSTAPTGSFAWPQAMQSPVMYNTVRRMTDTNLSLFPLAQVSYRLGYAQNIMQGPSLSPSYTIGSADALLMKYERNSTDDFTGSIEWKPLPQTRITYEQQITHYKNNTYFTLAPTSLIAQEADGTKVALGAWDSLEPIGWGLPTGSTSSTSLTYTVSKLCATASMGSGYTSAANYTIFTANPNGGLPIINPACNVLIDYLRAAPYRILTPTETLRFQSSSIRNLELNGDIRFTMANMNLPSYYDAYQGLNGATRQVTIAGVSKANRQSLAADLGALWRLSQSVTLANRSSFVTIHQPGWVNMTGKTTQAIPAASVTAGLDTVNYIGAYTTTVAATGATVWSPNSLVNTQSPGYFGQESFVNNFTVSWALSTRARFSLTYRYGNRTVAQGVPHNIPIPNDEEIGDPVFGTITINENAGILNTVLHPASNFDISSSMEFAYADNAVTPVSPRQTHQYKIRMKYRAAPWAVFSAAYTGRERHNNTYNNQAYNANAATTGGYYAGQVAHKDYNRNFSLNASIQKNEQYGLDVFYAYTQSYATTNICFDAVSSSYNGYLPGAATASGTPCPQTIRGGGYTLYAADFISAPTQFGSVSLMAAPVKQIRSNVGLRISSVKGSRFFNDARDVNGSIVSTYQSPFVNLAWTMRPSLVWKAEYSYFSYGEGGAGGAQYCTTANPTSLSTAATVVPCSTLSLTAASSGDPAGATAPRNFHANNVALGVHYEF